MKTIIRVIALGVVGIGLLALSGCEESGTDTNEPSGNSNGVTLQSGTYTEPALQMLPNAVAVTDFQFCITKIQLTAGDGTAVTDDTGASSIEAILGLIDVSNPATAVEWGVLDIPVGYELGELMVEVHHDPENCAGAAFSLSYNGTQLTQDLEFKFTFTPPVALDTGDVLTLGLTNIAATIQAASDAGQLTDAGITAYVESMVEEGSEE